MFFRDSHAKSLWPKCLVFAALTLSILVSADILFGNRLELALWNNPYRTDGDLIRDGMLLACFVIYLCRVYVTVFVFFRRIMFWREALAITNLMPWCFVAIAYYGGLQSAPIGSIEVGGAVLFLCGSYLNSAGEYGRYQWKMDPTNAGHLYTKGLFAHVRHINYLGDVLLFSGIALVARQFGLLVIPLSMAFIFLFVLIPLKERYLSVKYGEEFKEYAAKSKMLFPMVF